MTLTVFARAALSTTLGRSGTLAILEATDTSDGAASTSRLVIRIHVPEHQSMGFGDRTTPAYDACYRLEYRQPLSEVVDPPERIRCPSGATPLVPAHHRRPGPTLPAEHRGRSHDGPQRSPTRTDRGAGRPRAPGEPPRRGAGSAPPYAAGTSRWPRRDRQRGGRRVPVAARIDGRVSEAYAPDRMQLMPGEAGCTAFIGLPD